VWPHLHDGEALHAADEEDRVVVVRNPGSSGKSCGQGGEDERCHTHPERQSPPIATGGRIVAGGAGARLARYVS